MAGVTATGIGDSVRFGLLGSLQVVDGSGKAWAVPAAKQRVILAALLLGRGRVVSAASLAEALWDGFPPRNESAVLRTYMTRLRRVLGPAGNRIVGQPPGWAVELRGPEEFDLTEVDHLWFAARAEAAAGNWVRASAQLSTALSMWRGEPLVDVPSAVLSRREAGLLAELRVALTEARIEADLRLGRHGELVAELRRLVAEHPLREHFRAQLMIACFGCGQQAAALDAYRDAYRTLADELGLEPGRELQEIHLRILSGDQTVAADVPAVVVVRSATRSDTDGPSQSDPPDGATGGRAHVRSIRALAQAREMSQARADELVADHRNGGTLPAVPRQLPAAPRYFVGRRSELAWLARRRREMGAAGAVVVSAISGMAGVGKTALALHWAHRVAGDFRDGQLYADLGGFGPAGIPVQPAAVLRGFLDGLGVVAERVPRSLEAQAGLYRSLVAGRRMLIVLDNAQDVEQVRPLLPGSPGCHVLVTSRARLAGLAVGGNAELLALDVLSDDEACLLLAGRLGSDRVALEPGAVDELIGLCAGLPLAVAIAAARAAAHPGFPLAGLAAELCDAARRLDGLDAGDAATSLRSVLSWSYQQLAELPARMFRLLSVHPGPSVSPAAAASMAGIALRQARDTLRALADANLISKSASGRYAVHDLLRAFAAEQADAAEPAEDRRAAVCRMLDYYLHTVNAAGLMTLWCRDGVTLIAPQPGVSPETFAARDQALAWLDTEHAVLVKLTGQAAEAGFDVHAWQLAWSLAVFFRMRGRWQDLVATQRVALGAARRLRDPKAQAWIHRELGFACAQVGRVRQAHTHLGRAIRLYQALGDHDGQARTQLTVGIVWESQGRDRDALRCTLDVLRSPPADPHPRQTSITPVTRGLALNNLGWYHARLGELSEARIRCEQALRLFRGIDFPYGEATTLDSLGYICRLLGDHDRAVDYYRLVADQFRQIGDLHELAQVLGRLGDSCQAVSDTAAARDAWQQAGHIMDSLRHPDAEQIHAKLRELNSVSSQAG